MSVILSRTSIAGIVTCALALPTMCQADGTPVVVLLPASYKPVSKFFSEPYLYVFGEDESQRKPAIVYGASADDVFKKENVRVVVTLGLPQVDMRNSGYLKAAWRVLYRPDAASKPQELVTGFTIWPVNDQFVNANTPISKKCEIFLGPGSARVLSADIEAALAVKLMVEKPKGLTRFDDFPDSKVLVVGGSRSFAYPVVRRDDEDVKKATFTVAMRNTLPLPIVIEGFDLINSKTGKLTHKTERRKSPIGEILPGLKVRPEKEGAFEIRVPLEELTNDTYWVRPGMLHLCLP